MATIRVSEVGVRFGHAVSVTDGDRQLWQKTYPFGFAAQARLDAERWCEAHGVSYDRRPEEPRCENLRGSTWGVALPGKVPMPGKVE